MVRFLDGPAKGTEHLRGRVPIMLRVERNELTGEFDGLDQLSDTPDALTEPFVYRLVDGTESSGFVDFRGKNGRREGRRFVGGDYRLWPSPPTVEILRDNVRWQRWCTDNQAAILAGRPAQ